MLLRGHYTSQRACLQRHLIAFPVVFHHDWPQSRPIDISDLRRVYLLCMAVHFLAVYEMPLLLVKDNWIVQPKNQEAAKHPWNIPFRAATIWLFLTGLDVSVLTSSNINSGITALFRNYLKLLRLPMFYYNVIKQERGGRDRLYRLGNAGETSRAPYCLIKSNYHIFIRF